MQDQAAATARGHVLLGGHRGHDGPVLDLVAVTLAFRVHTFCGLFRYVLIHNENALEQKSVLIVEC